VSPSRARLIKLQEKKEAEKPKFNLKDIKLEMDMVDKAAL